MKCRKIMIEVISKHAYNPRYMVECPRLKKKVNEIVCTTCRDCRITMAQYILCEYREEED